jgi:hypothetical protein
MWGRGTSLWFNVAHRETERTRGKCPFMINFTVYTVHHFLFGWPNFRLAEDQSASQEALCSMQFFSYCCLSQLSVYINRTDVRSTKDVGGFHNLIKRSKNFPVTTNTILWIFFIYRHFWQNGGYIIAVGKNDVILIVNIKCCRTECSEVNEQCEVTSRITNIDCILETDLDFDWLKQLWWRCCTVSKQKLTDLQF